MPWRKRYDHSLSMEAKGQRAYEVCFPPAIQAELMLIDIDLG